jgi:hypothetical protein
MRKIKKKANAKICKYLLSMHHGDDDGDYYDDDDS